MVWVAGELFSREATLTPRIRLVVHALPPHHPYPVGAQKSPGQRQPPGAIRLHALLHFRFL
jgi:hypothetical protein